MKRIILQHKSLILFSLLFTFSFVLFEATSEHFFHDYFPEHADGYFTYRKLMPECALTDKTAEYEEELECPFNLFLSCLEQFSHYDPNGLSVQVRCVPKPISDVTPGFNSEILYEFAARAPPSA